MRCEGDNGFPLHFAAEKQHFPIIRLLVEHGAEPIGEGDYHELEVIGWATAWGYVNANREIVDYLLAHGAKHNIFSSVAVGEVETIRQLVTRSHTELERRMDLANKRRMPLHLAVVKKQPASLTTLLDLGANLESLDEAGFTALDEAALRGETAMAQVLLDRGARFVCRPPLPYREPGTSTGYSEGPRKSSSRATAGATSSSAPVNSRPVPSSKL
jgi:ankyrin repeat protein